MVARELAYNIVVGAVRNSGVDNVFGGVNRRLQSTQAELSATLDRQKELNTEITRARRAGENYENLQQELITTKMRVTELNASIQEQQSVITRNNERAATWNRRMRRLAAGATILAGALTALIFVQGDYSRSLVNAAQATGQSAEELERLDQVARRLTGQALSPEVWIGITDSIRQMQMQFRLGTDLSEDQLIAFQRLGINPFSAATLGAEDWYNALLRVPPQYQAITAAAVPGLSSIYTALRPALERGEAWNEVLAETVGLSDETHERYARGRQRLGDLGRAFRNAGTEAAAGFVPILNDVLDVLVPITRGFARFVEQNPNVVRALAAIGIGLGGVTTALWLANTAATFFAAVSGVGLPLIAGAAIAAGAVAAAGGVAFALGGGFGGMSGTAEASAQEQQEAAQARTAQQQRDNDRENTDRIVNTVAAGNALTEAVFERSRQELDPILRAIDCLETRVEQVAPTDAGPPSPFRFTDEEFAAAAGDRERRTNRIVDNFTDLQRRFQEGLNQGPQPQDFDAALDAFSQGLGGRNAPRPFNPFQQAFADALAQGPQPQRSNQDFRQSFGDALSAAVEQPRVSPEAGRRAFGEALGGPALDREPTTLQAAFQAGLNQGPQPAPIYNPAIGPQQVPQAQLPERDITVTNNFYDTPDPANEIVRETEAALDRVRNRR